jgi:hypothetical protein
MPIRPLALGLVLGLTAIACKAEPVEAGPPAELAVKMVQAAPVLHPEVTMSLASFRDDRLDDCTDYAGPTALVEKFTEFQATLGEQRPLSIPKRCAEQFADRVVVATCVVAKLETKIGQLSATSRHYNIRTAADSDSYMRDCLSMGGDWRLNPDKDVVAAERRRDNMRKFEKAVAKAEAAAAR